MRNARQNDSPGAALLSSELIGVRLCEMEELRKRRRKRCKVVLEREYGFRLSRDLGMSGTTFVLVASIWSYREMS